MKYLAIIRFNAKDDADASEYSQQMAQMIPGAKVEATVGGDAGSAPIELEEES